MRQFGQELKDAGVVVYEPSLHEGQDEWDNLSRQYKEYVALGLTHDHFYKIQRADVVYVYNQGGYSGVSTTMEIAYAVALGKPIYAHSGEDDELCRRVLFKEVVPTAKKLIPLLK